MNNWITVLISLIITIIVYAILRSQGGHGSTITFNLKDQPEGQKTRIRLIYFAAFVLLIVAIVVGKNNTDGGVFPMLINLFALILIVGLVLQKAVKK